MIRMITCDIDGTLLHEGAWELEDRYFPLIREVLSRGIVFAAASGRQYDRLRRMFAPVADDIFFIGENGAVVFEGDRLLSETPLNKTGALALIDEILAIPECEVLISGARNCYLIPKTDDYVHLVCDLLAYRTVIVPAATEIPEPIIKIAAYRKEGITSLAERFAPTWGERFNMAIAGATWLDFTLSDKGTGLDVLCRATGIDPKDVLSFGDNFNDLPLLEKVGHPYIMDNAVDELRAKFSHHCADVGQVLADFLSENGRNFPKLLEKST